MVAFLQVTDEDFARISILGVESHGAFCSTVHATVNDGEVTLFAKLDGFFHGNLKRLSAGILTWLVTFLAPNHGKITLEAQDLAAVGSFAHLFLGGNGHGSELFLDGGGWRLFGSRRALFLGSSFGRGDSNGCGNGGNGSSCEDWHDDGSGGIDGRCELCALVQSCAVVCKARFPSSFHGCVSKQDWGI